MAAPEAGGSNRGVVYLFSGDDVAAGGEIVADDDALYAVTGAAGDRIGMSGPLGDLDGDQVVDFALTTPYYDSSLSNVGGVYVFLSSLVQD